MTGYFVRIKREGRYMSLDIAELTDEELHTFGDTLDRDRAAAWMVVLAKWIRENVTAMRGQT